MEEKAYLGNYRIGLVVELRGTGLNGLGLVHGTEHPQLKTVTVSNELSW